MNRYHRASKRFFIGIALVLFAVTVVGLLQMFGVW